MGTLKIGDLIALVGIELAVLHLLGWPWWLWLVVLGLQTAANGAHDYERRRRDRAEGRRLAERKRRGL